MSLKKLIALVIILSFNNFLSAMQNKEEEELKRKENIKNFEKKYKDIIYIKFIIFNSKSS